MENRAEIRDEPAKSIFLDALEIAGAEQRRGYLDRRCGADARLRAEVESLLRHHDQLGDYLEQPPADAVPTQDLGARAPLEAAGTLIGPYKLLEPIGEGGMGVVYMAEQTRPVRRKVALKIIKPGMDTRQVIARFEAERQALALMDHPNIARVLDGGTTESGLPYFVMELVRGVPITDYCDRAQLAIPERLDLFVLVCRAVQHAHQKGIIHRDIKPTNVLITLHDGVPVPKVIDFGVAKATGQSLTDKSLYTGFLQLVGTPLYMSPEQAEMSGLDVDTRSDIYSLGVLLYELLTGTTPFDQETFRTASLDEIRRIIREQEPPRPSTRLSTLGATTTTVSANRKVEPRQLNRLVRGELDWIVMKALEKDRSRRYETANDFAADVMRYLADEPVDACPPSAWYRFTKYVRRHRVAFTSVAALLLVAVIVLVATTVLAINQRELTQRRLAVQEGINSALTEVTRLRSQTQAIALGDRNAAIRIRDQLQRALALTEAGPSPPAVAEQVRALLDEFEKESLDQQLIQALDEAWLAQANTDPNQWRWAPEQCIPRLSKALEARGLLVGQTPPEEAAAAVGRMPENVRLPVLVALEEWARCRTISPGITLRPVAGEKANPSELPQTSVSRQLRMFDRIVGYQLGRDGSMVATRPGTIFMHSGRYLSPAPGTVVRLQVLHPGQSNARTYEVVPDPTLYWLRTVVKAADKDHWRQRMREAADLTDSVEQRTALEQLADEANVQQQPVRILTLLSDRLLEFKATDRAIKLSRHVQRRSPGDVHANLSLADVLRKVDPPRLEEAARYYTAALALCPASACTHVNLGVVLSDLGKPEEAIEQYREALRRQPDFSLPVNNLCFLLHKQGKQDEGITEWRNFVQRNPTDSWARYSLGTALMERGNLEEAVAQLREAVRLDPNQSPIRINLGSALRRQGKFDDAIAQFREGLRRFPAFGFRIKIAITLQEQGKLDEALAECREAIRLNPNDPGARNDIGVVFERAGRPKDAIAEFREAIRIDPRRWYPYANLALLKANTPQPEFRDLGEAMTLARKAVELAPQSNGPLYALGMVQYRAGNWKDAQASLEKAYDLDRNPLWQSDICSGWFFLAMAHWQRGEKYKATTWYDKAVAWMDKNKQPQDEDLKRFRAEAAALMGLNPPTPGATADAEPTIPSK